MSTKKGPGRRLAFIAIAVVLLAVLASMAFVATSRGQDKAQEMELRNVQQAVSLMMADNNITTLPNPVTEPTTDMSLFPDATTPPEAKGLLSDDKPGYVLWGHDMTADGQPEPAVEYVGSGRTKWAYTITGDGVVAQSNEVQE